jgi:hypothetical protein
MTSPKLNSGYEVQQDDVREVAVDLSVNMNLEAACSIHIYCETLTLIDPSPFYLDDYKMTGNFIYN